jgi:hypothetical protein
VYVSYSFLPFAEFPVTGLAGAWARAGTIWNASDTIAAASVNAI